VSSTTAESIIAPESPLLALSSSDALSRVRHCTVNFTQDAARSGEAPSG
jgi:hypothetical protein